jgi:hypothetical protein
MGNLRDSATAWSRQRGVSGPETARAFLPHFIVSGRCGVKIPRMPREGRMVLPELFFFPGVPSQRFTCKVLLMQAPFCSPVRGGR